MDEYPEAGRKELKKLLETEAGKRIYEKLEAKPNADDSPGAPRKACENEDFRVDKGYRDDKRGVRHSRARMGTDS